MILPSLSLFTICFLFFSSEWLAWHVFPEPQESTLGCLVLNDSTTGVRAIPNTICRGKLDEGPLVEYRFNSCGHRAGMECGPKSPDTYRIVLVGSSMAEGYGVTREQSFASLLPAELTRRSGRKIEVYNAAMQWGSPRTLDLQFKQALALQPDMILWPVSVWELSNVDLITYQRGNHIDADLGSIWKTVVSTFHSRGFATAAETGIVESIVAVLNSRTQLMIRHYVYMSPSLYMGGALKRDLEVDYLSSTPNANAQNHIRQFDRYAADIAAQAKAAGVPLVVSMLPLRSQAVMISAQEWPTGFSPYQSSDYVRPVVESNGGVFLDILPNFRNISEAGSYFYPVDGHPNPAGHRILSTMLAEALMRGPLAGHEQIAPTSQAHGF